MKIWIEKDERYPDFNFLTEPGEWELENLKSAEVSGELLSRLEAAFAEYGAVQALLWELHWNGERHG